MSFIEKKDIANVATYFEEDIESVTMFPQTGVVKVKTYRRFYNAEGDMVRSEAGDEETFTHDVTNMVNGLRQALKQRRGK